MPVTDGAAPSRTPRTHGAHHKLSRMNFPDEDVGQYSSGVSSSLLQRFWNLTTSALQYVAAVMIISFAIAISPLWLQPISAMIFGDFIFFKFIVYYD